MINSDVFKIIFSIGMGILAAIIVGLIMYIIPDTGLLPIIIGSIFAGQTYHRMFYGRSWA